MSLYEQVYLAYFIKQYDNAVKSKNSADMAYYKWQIEKEKEVKQYAKMVNR